MHHNLDKSKFFKHFVSYKLSLLKITIYLLYIIKNFKNSLFECLCKKCWQFPPTNLIAFSEWLTVEFLNDNKLFVFEEEKVRIKIAEWINEECAIIIRCKHNILLDSRNILIGGLEQDFIDSKVHYLHIISVYFKIINDTTTNTGNLKNNKFFQ